MHKLVVRCFTPLALATAMSACAPVPISQPSEPEYEPVPAQPKPLVDQSATGSIYNSATARELFRDIKAYRVGDVLTVHLQENTNAQMSSNTSTQKDDSNALGATAILGVALAAGKNPFQVDTDNSRSFSGSGSSAQSNRLSGQLSVTVHDVLANGNLVIRGEKRTTVNQGMEFLRISGIVRPEDVSGDNEVVSTRIADAHVSYGGRGVIRDSNRAGWASRMMNSEWWPF